MTEHPVVSQLSLRFSARPNTTTRRHYDRKRPSLLLESRFTAEFTPALEDYSYPLFFEKNAVNCSPRQTLERHRTDYQLAEANSTRQSRIYWVLSGNSEHSSCWLRVSSSWAVGKFRRGDHSTHRHGSRAHITLSGRQSRACAASRDFTDTTIYTELMDADYQ